jgi:hypothetical protein
MHRTAAEAEDLRTIRKKESRLGDGDPVSVQPVAADAKVLGSSCWRVCAYVQPNDGLAVWDSTVRDFFREGRPRRGSNILRFEERRTHVAVVVTGGRQFPFHFVTCWRRPEPRGRPLPERDGAHYLLEGKDAVAFTWDDAAHGTIFPARVLTAPDDYTCTESRIELTDANFGTTLWRECTPPPHLCSARLVIISEKMRECLEEGVTPTCGKGDCATVSAMLGFLMRCYGRERNLGAVTAELERLFAAACAWLDEGDDADAVARMLTHDDVSLCQQLAAEAAERAAEWGDEVPDPWDDAGIASEWARVEAWIRRVQRMC